MKATVDKETCTGCALCEQTCGDVFKMENDLAVVAGEAVPAELEETCKQAAEECPVEAIKIEG